MALTRYYAELDQLKLELDKPYNGDDGQIQSAKDKWWKASFCNAQSLENSEAYVKELIKKQRSKPRSRLHKPANKSHFVPLENPDDYIRKYTENKIVKNSHDATTIRSNQFIKENISYKSSVKTKNCVLDV